MSARTDDPIILSGTTETGTRYVQFWTETEKIAGREVAFCRASMHDGDAYAPDLLRIAHGCPPEWVERILALFPGFFTGGDIRPTHTVTWAFGTPTFHPIETSLSAANGATLDKAVGR